MRSTPAIALLSAPYPIPRSGGAETVWPCVVGVRLEFEGVRRAYDLRGTEVKPKLFPEACVGEDLLTGWRGGVTAWVGLSAGDDLDASWRGVRTNCLVRRGDVAGGEEVALIWLAARTDRAPGS